MLSSSSTRSSGSPSTSSESAVSALYLRRLASNSVKCHSSSPFPCPEQRLGGAGEARGDRAEGRGRPRPARRPGCSPDPRSPPLARKGENPPAGGFNRSTAPPACRPGNSRRPAGTRGEGRRWRRGAGGRAAGRGPPPARKVTARRPPPPPLRAPGWGQGGKFNFPRLRLSPRRGGSAPAAGPSPPPPRSPAHAPGPRPTTLGPGRRRAADGCSPRCREASLGWQRAALEPRHRHSRGGGR